PASGLQQQHRRLVAGLADTGRALVAQQPPQIAVGIAAPQLMAQGVHEGSQTHGELARLVRRIGQGQGLPDQRARLVQQRAPQAA
ncbi:hypothetical protein C1T28_21310, partial [Bacillus subtilis]